MWRPKGWVHRGMAYEAGADALLMEAIKWLLRYDDYTQYTGKSHNDLVRRLDIPNKEMEAFTGEKY